MSDTFKPFSYVGVPLVVRARTAGVISFGTTSDLSNREYTDADLPLIEADVKDPAALGELASSTRVLITTVGPYWSGSRRRA